MTSWSLSWQGDPLGGLRRRAQPGWVNVGQDHETATFAVESSGAGGEAMEPWPIRRQIDY